MRRRRTLSAEERRLWGEVARSTRPMPGRLVPSEDRAETPADAPPNAAPPVAAKAGTKTAGASASGAGRPAAAAVLPLLHPIERPVRRRIGRGRVALDDRIDLHGLTEAVAHSALLGFLRRAQAAGARHVLVITGRGASFGSQGALKRALPHWFATGEFRLLVAGYETAERNHGGEGAFYVRVRRR